MAWYCSFENFAFFEIIQMFHIIPEWHEHLSILHQPCFLKSSTNHSNPWVRIMCSLHTPQPICRSTSGLDVSVEGCRSSIGRYVGRHIDRYVGRYLDWMLDRYVGRYSGRHSADMLTVDYRRNISRVSVVYRSTVSGLSVNCLTI